MSRKINLVETSYSELPRDSQFGKKIWAVDPTSKGLSFVGNLREISSKLCICYTDGGRVVERVIERLPEYYKLFVEGEEEQA